MPLLHKKRFTLVTKVTTYTVTVTTGNCGCDICYCGGADWAYGGGDDDVFVVVFGLVFLVVILVVMVLSVVEVLVQGGERVRYMRLIWEEIT